MVVYLRWVLFGGLHGFNQLYEGLVVLTIHGANDGTTDGYMVIDLYRKHLYDGYGYRVIEKHTPSMVIQDFNQS